MQDACKGDMNMMRHCRQCRADAVGLLGEDRSDEFTTEKIEEMEVVYDRAKRKAYQEKVEAGAPGEGRGQEGRAECCARADDGMKMLMAVATKGDGKVNEHFGHATEFQIYEVAPTGAKFVGHRRVDQYCQGGYGEEELCRPSSAPSTIAMRYSSPRSVVARRTN